MEGNAQIFICSTLAQLWLYLDPCGSHLGSDTSQVAESRNLGGRSQQSTGWPLCSAVFSSWDHLEDRPPARDSSVSGQACVAQWHCCEGPVSPDGILAIKLVTVGFRSDGVKEKVTSCFLEGFIIITMKKRALAEKTVDCF